MNEDYFFLTPHYSRNVMLYHKKRRWAYRNEVEKWYKQFEYAK